jgi:hypothetical protein
MKTQKTLNKENGCKYTFMALCIMLAFIIFLFLVSCRESICPAYTSTGSVYYPYPKKQIHSQRMNGSLHEPIYKRLR